jgi:hypothetical protein
MAGLTWLHLSDWHQKGEDFDRKVVRDAFTKRKEKAWALFHRKGKRRKKRNER